jgi:serine/threonine protein kinase
MNDSNQIFSQVFIEKVMHDLFHPLGLMHAQDIIHRDISLSNILIKQKNNDGTVDIVLSDFDYLRVLREEDSTLTYVGKERYSTRSMPRKTQDKSRCMVCRNCIGEANETRNQSKRYSMFSSITNIVRTLEYIKMILLHKC